MVAIREKVNIPAEKWQRIIAWMIDHIMLAFFGVLSHPNDFITACITTFVMHFTYYFIMEVIWDRTLGKLIMGIIIVDAERENYDEKRMIKLVFIRTLCRYIPLDPLSFFFTDNGQLWHDNISNTTVILNKSRFENYFI